MVHFQWRRSGRSVIDNRTSCLFDPGICCLRNMDDLKKGDNNYDNGLYVFGLLRWRTQVERDVKLLDMWNWRNSSRRGIFLEKFCTLGQLNRWRPTSERPEFEKGHKWLKKSIAGWSFLTKSARILSIFGELQKITKSITMVNTSWKSVLFSSNKKMSGIFFEKHATCLFLGFLS